MRYLLVALALTASSPALAQSTSGHEHMHGHGVKAGREAPPAKSGGAADSHTGHGSPDPQPPAPPAVSSSPHAGHQAMEDRTGPPIAGPPPAALAGPEHAADLRFDPQEMRAARLGMRQDHGAVRAHKVMIDHLEWQGGDGPDAYAWEAQAWFGGDIDKLWLKTSGEGEFGDRLERAELQALWSRAIDPWFDFQTGVRHDFRRGADRTYATLGVHGLAPYWIELDAAAFVSDRGKLSARIEAQHDMRLTERLILQPLVQFDLAAQDDREQRVGAGLSSIEAALRLRYEIRPEIAPYLGVEYERAFGRTAAFQRADGQDVEAVRLLGGVRFWF